MRSALALSRWLAEVLMQEKWWAAVSVVRSVRASEAAGQPG
jgi:hypothetical protein